MTQKKITRRDALKTLGANSLAVSILPLWAGSPLSLDLLEKIPAKSNRFSTYPAQLRKISPINRDMPSPSPLEYSGDNPLRAHEALWSKEDFLKAHGGLPMPKEQAEIVIVGGGMSGLFSAWELRKHKPILLELGDRFGGNAKGESWNGVDYSIGSAYFIEQEKNSPLYNLFSELGLYEISRTKEKDDPIFFQKKLFEAFWSGETDTPRAEEFKKIARHFSDMYKNENGLIYPEIPTYESKMKQYVNRLDKENFFEYMKRINKGPLHPHISCVLEHYCWSSLGAGMKDLSAAVALNTYAAEFGKIYVAPGGNARLAERVMEKLLEHISIENMRAESLVIDVRVVGKRVHVTYADRNGSLKSISAKSVIMACPKFVVSKILNGIELARSSAIAKLSYHPYLLANICLRKKIVPKFYDAFLMKDGIVDSNNPAQSSQRHKTTDMIFATYANPTASSAVLTLYRPLPWKEARAELFAEKSYETVRTEFEKEIREDILPIVGANENDISEIRITRWGHPIPIASPGHLFKGTAEAAHAPHKERVFFVEQDNWMLPAIETSAIESLRWAKKARRILQDS